MDEEFDFEKEFDEIVNDLKKKALKTMWAGYLIGVITGCGVTYMLFHS